MKFNSEITLGGMWEPLAYKEKKGPEWRTEVSTMVTSHMTMLIHFAHGPLSTTQRESSLMTSSIPDTSGAGSYTIPSLLLGNLQ